MGVIADASPIPETYFGPKEKMPWWDPRETESAVFLDHDLMGMDALEAAGLNWTVSKRPQYFPSIWGEGEQRRAGRTMATVRDTDEKYLGSVMPGFQIFQNVDLVTLGDELLGRGGAFYHTGGSLYEGRIVWLLAQFDKAIHVKGDGSPIAAFLALINGHDGRHGCTALTTMTRIWCGNTCQQALDGAQDKVTLRHVPGMTGRVEQIRAVLDVHAKYRETLEAVLNNLADRPMTIEEVKAFTTVLIPQDPNVKQAPKTQAKRDLIVDLFTKSPTLDGVPLTAYRAYQAVTEFADHYSPLATTTTGSGKDRAALATIEGAGYVLKTQATALLLKA